MKSPNRSKLSLNRTTLRRLDGDTLSRIAGGAQAGYTFSTLRTNTALCPPGTTVSAVTICTFGPCISYTCDDPCQI